MAEKVDVVVDRVARSVGDGYARNLAALERRILLTLSRQEVAIEATREQLEAVRAMLKARG